LTDKGELLVETLTGAGEELRLTIYDSRPTVSSGQARPTESSGRSRAEYGVLGGFLVLDVFEFRIMKEG
jgi:hypothetical protein